MGGLRKFVDKIKPTFSEGGKLSFLASTFDAFETFLFVPNTTTSRGAHIRDCNDMKRTMIVVDGAPGGLQELCDDRGGRGADAGLVVRYVQYGLPGGHDRLGSLLVRFPRGAADDRGFLRGRSGHRVLFRPEARTRSQ